MKRRVPARSSRRKRAAPTPAPTTEPRRRRAASAPTPSTPRRRGSRLRRLLRRPLVLRRLRARRLQRQAAARSGAPPAGGGAVPVQSGEPFKIVECPRDAWQGLPKVIPTAEKVAYLRALVAAGFRHLDAVSFVSPRRVPQMADAEKVLEALFAGGSGGSQTGAPPPSGAARGTRSRGARAAGGAAPQAPPPQRSPDDTAIPTNYSYIPEVSLEGVEIIGIVLNEQGLERALAAPGVTTIGVPYSLSATFQRQNANQSPQKARELVASMHESSRRAWRGFVVYLSMAFGNPYGDPYSPELVAAAVDWLRDLGVRSVSLADTAGSATPDGVRRLFAAVLPHAGGIEFGLHLHTLPQQAEDKVRAAYEAGCRRLDGALGGLGGCPFAGDRLVGNLPTERALSALATLGVEVPPTPGALALPLLLNQEIAHKYGS